MQQIHKSFVHVKASAFPQTRTSEGAGGYVKVCWPAIIAAVAGIFLTITGSANGVSITKPLPNHITIDAETQSVISTFTITQSTTTSGSPHTNSILITGSSHAGDEQTVVFVTAHH
jgi:hypothetical protein